MSKHKQIKAQHTEHLIGPEKQVTQILQANEYDTNPLPSPEELAKYKDINETLVSTFIESGRLEQEFRHNISYKSIELIEKDQIHFINKDKWFFRSLIVINFILIFSMIGFAYIEKPFEALFIFAIEVFTAYKTYFLTSKEDKNNPANN